MLKISKMTDYAVVVLGELALAYSAPDTALSAADLARRTDLPLTTVAKVLKLLARAGLVTSARGAAGGYRLSRGADAIRVPEIIAAIDGPVQLTDCVGEHHVCMSACASRGRWDDVNRTVLTALSDISLMRLLPPATPFSVEARHG